MKLANVRIAKEVLGNFFIEQPGRCFGVQKGLPINSKLIKFSYDIKSATHIATFSSDDFAEIKPGGKIPFLEVEYMAYQLVPDEGGGESGEASNKLH